MKIKLLIAAIITSSLITGCTKQLEVQPVSEITNAIYWKAEGDVTGYLTGIYSDFRGLMNSTYFFEDRGDAFIPGLEGSATEAYEQNLNNLNAPLWTNHYNLVHHTNLVLKYGPGITFGDQNKKNRTLAEAQTMRAYLYFLLVKAWGKVPLILEPTESDNVPFPARSSETEVLTLVLDDLEKALALFPDAGYPNKGRISKNVAQAIKADVLLWRAKVYNGGDADLTNALTAVDAAMGGLSLQTNFQDVFATDKKKNAEISWALHFQRDERSDQYGSRLKPRDIFVSGATNKDLLAFAKNGARSVYAPSPKIEAAFAANDKRKAWSVIRALDLNGATIGVFDNKFRGTLHTDDRYYDNDIVMYRLGELLLTKAEILAALRRPEEAITELEKVRNRAGTGVYTGLRTKEVVEREIFNERFRELFFELKRWNDIVRFHYGGTIDAYTEVPKLVGKTIPLFFPIRKTQIDLNPKLEQTDGYNN
ncbi:MAG: RagB/SusD family nutrient uptake outer membrane protein [Pseudobacter sp.]|uniref:RagB/SusD family nutrient uptake outer membrane protein n=1 Tax=Pseudobacter sp. TaxID=2045420 RepID=UPI003F7F814E